MARKPRLHLPGALPAMLYGNDSQRIVNNDNNNEDRSRFMGLVAGGRTCAIHKCCGALACSFVRNEYIAGRPYARLRSLSLESVAKKSRRNHHSDS